MVFECGASYEHNGLGGVGDIDANEGKSSAREPLSAMHLFNGSRMLGRSHRRYRLRNTHTPDVGKLPKFQRTNGDIPKF